MGNGAGSAGDSCVSKKLYFRFLSVIFVTGSLGIFPLGVMADDILDIYELAQKNDRTYSAATYQFEALKQGQRQVKGLYYPNLDFSYEYLDTDQTINRSDNEVFGTGQSDYPTNVLNLSLTQPLFRWDYRTERKRANAEVTQGEFELIAAEQELILRSAENYLLALAAQDTRVMAQAELNAVGEQLKLSEKRFDIGLANTGEVNESRARYQLNQAELIQSENAVSDRMEALAVIVGTIPDSLAPLKDTFQMVPPEPADAQAWVTRAEQDNLAVQSGTAAVEVADAEYARQKADRYPDIDLFANLDNRDAEGSLFGGGSDVDTTDIGIRARWTLYQGGRLTAKIREALANKMQAEDELEVTRANVRRETRSAYLGVVSGISRAAALKLSLDAQDMSVKAKQKGFDTGTNSNLEVLDAKRDFYFVQRDYLKARYDYLLSMLNLKRLVGNLTPGDLEQLNSVLVGGFSRVSRMPEQDAGMIENIGESTSPLDAPVIEAESMEAPAADELEVIPDASSDGSFNQSDPTMSEPGMIEGETGVLEDPVEDPVGFEESAEVTEPGFVEDTLGETTDQFEAMPEPVSIEEPAEAVDVVADAEAGELTDSIEAVEGQPDLVEQEVDAVEESSQVTEPGFVEDMSGEATDQFEAMPEAETIEEPAEAVDVVADAEADELTETIDAIEGQPDLEEPQVDTVEEPVDVTSEPVTIEETIEEPAEVVKVFEPVVERLLSMPAFSYTIQLATADDLERCQSVAGEHGPESVTCIESSTIADRWFSVTESHSNLALVSEAVFEMGAANMRVNYVPRIIDTRCEMLKFDEQYRARCTETGTVRDTEPGSERDTEPGNGYRGASMMFNEHSELLAQY